MEKQHAVLYYTELSGVTSSVTSNILNTFLTNITTHADQWPSVAQQLDPYRAPMQDYTWGSNQIKMAQARLYQLLAKYEVVRRQTLPWLRPRSTHYLHGVNPLGLVYLTNMQRAGAEHSAKTAYHTWFADQTVWDEVTSTTPGPAPGFLVGGPNLSFSLDGCCSAVAGDDAYQCYGAAEFSLCSQNWEPPLNQPVQKRICSSIRVGPQAPGPLPNPAPVTRRNTFWCWQPTHARCSLQKPRRHRVRGGYPWP